MQEKVLSNLFRAAITSLWWLTFTLLHLWLCELLNVLTKFVLTQETLVLNSPQICLFGVIFAMRYKRFQVLDLNIYLLQLIGGHSLSNWSTQMTTIRKNLSILRRSELYLSCFAAYYLLKDLSSSEFEASNICFFFKFEITRN